MDSEMRLDVLGSSVKYEQRAEDAWRSVTRPLVSFVS